MELMTFIDSCRLVDLDERREWNKTHRDTWEVTPNIHVGTSVFVKTKHPKYDAAWVSVCQRKAGTWNATLLNEPGIMVSFAEKDVIITVNPSEYNIRFGDLEYVYQVPLDDLSQEQINALSDIGYRIFKSVDNDKHMSVYIAPMKWHDWDATLKILFGGNAA